VMPLYNRNDVFDTETMGAKEIIHRVARRTQFQIVDLVTNPTVGIGGTVVTGIFAPREGDSRAAGLGIENPVVGFPERAVINPDVAHRAAVAKINEIPVVLVVLSLGSFVPFPHFIELQIADD